MAGCPDGGEAGAAAVGGEVRGPRHVFKTQLPHLFL